jgi:hypothetical protein
MNSPDTGLLKEDRIRVELDRPFPFEPDVGFVWHKSWNLPEIVVQVVDDLEAFQGKQLFCEIMAVYPAKYSNAYYLNEIVLEGNCTRAIHNS